MADPLNPPTVVSNPVCRAVAGSSTCTTIALPAGYTIRGTTACRILYPQSNTDTALLNRNVDPTPSLLPLQGITIQLFEGAKDPTKDKPLAQAQSQADGTFQLNTAILKTGLEYKLLAIYKNDAAKLAEEHVLIEKIKVDALPDVGAETLLPLTQKNQPLKGKTNVFEESENIQVPLSQKTAGNPILDFSGKAVIAFATCLLDIAHISQVFLDDGKTHKVVNIDGFGPVSGGILCFPTSMAMMMDYYGQSPFNTTEEMADKNYRVWGAEQFPDQLSPNGPSNYKFVVKTATGSINSNIWEWWRWENRSARKIVGIATTYDWNNYQGDIDGKDDFPAADEWKSYWGNPSPLTSAEAPYFRRQFGRGWPCILGTNLTSAGHIILLRGLTIKADGSIYKLIVNNPYGTNSLNEGKALYYNSSTTAYDSSNTLNISHHLALRHGMSRDNVATHLLQGPPQ